MSCNDDPPLEADIYMTDEQIKEHIQRMGGLSRDSIVVLAELNGVSKQTMANHLGFETIKSAPLFNKADEELLKAYQNGMNDAQLVEKFGLSRWKIRAWRKENGFCSHYREEQKDEL